MRIFARNSQIYRHSIIVVLKSLSHIRLIFVQTILLQFRVLFNKFFVFTFIRISEKINYSIFSVNTYLKFYMIKEECEKYIKSACKLLLSFNFHGVHKLLYREILKCEY